MGKKGRGKKGRTRRHNAGSKDSEPEELKRAPHTFVVARGKTGKYVNNLVLNFRRVMEPFTASSLQMKKASVRDLASVAGHLGVSHGCVFSRTNVATYMKIGKFPRGPTLTFRIEDYTLTRDVLSSLKRMVTYAKQFSHGPLLILNNFAGADKAPQLQLISTTLQNLFPTINIHKIKLRHTRRVVLFSYNPDDDTIDFRHYTIKLAPVGVSRAVRKLITRPQLPDLGRLDDMAEFVTRSGYLSDSEAEDDPNSCVHLPQPAGSRGNNCTAVQSAIRLVELGPRITLKLLKIQAGLMDGDVLYHRLVSKSAQEVAVTRKLRQKREQEKLTRKQQQAANIRRKEELKQQLRQQSITGVRGEIRSDPGDLTSTDHVTWNQSDDGGHVTPDYQPSDAHHLTDDIGDECVDGVIRKCDGSPSSAEPKRSINPTTSIMPSSVVTSSVVSSSKPRKRAVIGSKIRKKTRVIGC